MIRTRRATLAVAATVALLMASSLAYAAIPDASGTVNGCYAKGGALRVIDTAREQCKAGETAIHWGVVGPAGAAGPQGQQGPQGPAGPTGPGGGQGPWC